MDNGIQTPPTAQAAPDAQPPQQAPVAAPQAPSAPLTVDAFAAKIKAKYPQYQSLSNAELTSKILAKYPVYRSQVQTTPSPQIGQPPAVTKAQPPPGVAAKPPDRIGISQAQAEANRIRATSRVIGPPPDLAAVAANAPVKLSPAGQAYAGIVEKSGERERVPAPQPQASDVQSLIAKNLTEHGNPPELANQFAAKIAPVVNLVVGPEIGLANAVDRVKNAATPFEQQQAAIGFFGALTGVATQVYFAGPMTHALAEVATSPLAGSLSWTGFALGQDALHSALTKTNLTPDQIGMLEQLAGFGAGVVGGIAGGVVGNVGDAVIRKAIPAEGETAFTPSEVQTNLRNGVAERLYGDGATFDSLNNQQKMHLLDGIAHVVVQNPDAVADYVDWQRKLAVKRTAQAVTDAAREESENRRAAGETAAAAEQQAKKGREDSATKAMADASAQAAQEQQNANSRAQVTSDFLKSLTGADRATIENWIGADATNGWSREARNKFVAAVGQYDKTGNLGRPSVAGGWKARDARRIVRYYQSVLRGETVDKTNPAEDAHAAVLQAHKAEDLETQAQQASPAEKPKLEEQAKQVRAKQAEIAPKAPAPKAKAVPPPGTPLADLKSRPTSPDRTQGVRREPIKPLSLGAAIEVLSSDGTKLPAHYAAVRLNDLRPSHNPWTWEWYADYPEAAQPRERTFDKKAKKTVEEVGSKPDPKQLFSTDPTAQVSPPVILPDGVVLAGNGRAMGMALAYDRGNGGAIAGAFPEQQGRYGDVQFSDADQPVPVILLDSDITDQQQLKRLGGALNVGAAGGLDAAEEGNMAASFISPAKMDEIAEQMERMQAAVEPDKEGKIEQTTLRKYMAKYSEQLGRFMVDSGMVPAQRAKVYVYQDGPDAGKLTEKGKDLFEAALRGRAFGDPALVMEAESVASNIIDKLDRSLGIVNKIKGRGGDWDFTQFLPEALRQWVRARNNYETVSKTGDKGDSLVDRWMFPDNYREGNKPLPGMESEIPKVSAILARALENSASEIKEALGQYAAEMAKAGDPNQTAMFGGTAGPDPIETFNATIAPLSDLKGQPDLRVTADDWKVDATQGARPAETVAPRVQPAEPPPGYTKEEVETKAVPPHTGGRVRLSSSPAAEAARAKFRKIVTGQQLNIGFDPEALSAALELGYYHFRDGIDDFTAWSKQMISDLGDAVKPYLNSAWHGIQDAIAAGMEFPGDKEVASDGDGQVEDTIRGKGRRRTAGSGAKTAPPDEPGGATRGGPADVSGGRTAGGRRATRIRVKEEERLTHGGHAAARVIELSPAPPPRPAVVPESEWQQRLKATGLSEGMPAPTSKLPDDIAAKLPFPGQKELGDYIVSSLDTNGGALLASGPGSGKSYQAAAVVADLVRKNPNARVLVLTKNRGLIEQEDRGLTDVFGQFGVQLSDLELAAVPTKPGVSATTYAMLVRHPELADGKFDLVVADESAAARRWWDSDTGALVKKLTSEAGKALYMSATPYHTPLELGYMEKLGLWPKGGFEQWVGQFGVRRKDGKWSGTVSPTMMAGFRAQMIQRGVFANMDLDLTGFNANFGVVPLSDVQHRQLVDIQTAFGMTEDWYRGRGQALVANRIRGLAVNFQKAWLERTRLPQVIEHVENLRENGWQAVIFTETKAGREELYKPLQEADYALSGAIKKLMQPLPSIVDALKERFGYDLADLTGPYDARRKNELAAYLSGKKNIAIGTYASIGEGVSLHDTEGTRPRAAVYSGVPYSGIQLHQGTGRLWRYGTKSDVHATFLFSDALPEKAVMDKVTARLASLNASITGAERGKVLDGLRGNDAARAEVGAYSLGGETRLDPKEFRQIADTSNYKNWKGVTVGLAENAKNRGVEFARKQESVQGPLFKRKGPPPGGEDEIQSAIRKLHPEVDRDTFEELAGLFTPDEINEDDFTGRVDSFLDSILQERDEDEKNEKRQRELDEEQGRKWDEQEKFKNYAQREVELSASELGIKVEREGRDSRYLTLEKPLTEQQQAAGDEPETITVRIADHEPKDNRGGYQGGEFGDEYYDQAELSVHPGGMSVADAKQIIGRWVRGEITPEQMIAAAKVDIGRGGKGKDAEWDGDAYQRAANRLLGRPEEKSAQKPLFKRAQPPPSSISKEEIEGGKVKIGADVGELAKKLGASMYSGNIGKTVGRELLQNAIDAVRAMPPGSQPEIRISNTKNTFTVSDNGAGMTPKQVSTVFTDLGSSFKTAGSTGGFGMAKAAFLLGGERTELNTTSIENGRYVRTTLAGTPEELMRGVTPVVTDLGPSSSGGQTGTTVTVTLPAGDLWYSESQRALDHAKDLVEGSLRMPAKVFFQKDQDRFREVATAEGKVPVLKTKVGGLPVTFYADPSMETVERAVHEVPVALNGLAQPGRARIWGGILPKGLIADVEVNVPPEHPDYPYTTNRETLKDKFGSELAKVATEKIGRPLTKDANARLEETFKQMPRAMAGKTSVPLFDPKGRVRATDAAALEKTPGWRELAGAVTDALRHVAEHSGIEKQVEHYGIAFDETIHGMNLLVGGEDAKTPTAIFINPFSRMSEMEPENAAAGIFNTIVHEVAHDAVRSHNADFAGTMGRVYASLAKESRRNYEDSIESAIRATGGGSGQLFAEYRKIIGRPAAATATPFKYESERAGSPGLGLPQGGAGQGGGAEGIRPGGRKAVRPPPDVEEDRATERVDDPSFKRAGPPKEPFPVGLFPDMPKNATEALRDQPPPGSVPGVEAGGEGGAGKPPGDQEDTPPVAFKRGASDDERAAEPNEIERGGPLKTALVWHQPETGPGILYVTPEGREHIARAFEWSGVEGVDDVRESPGMFIYPHIVKSLLNGKHGPELTAALKGSPEGMIYVLHEGSPQKIAAARLEEELHAFQAGVDEGFPGHALTPKSSSQFILGVASEEFLRSNFWATYEPLAERIANDHGADEARAWFAAEVGARLIAGRYDEMGMTQAAADAATKQYVKLVQEAWGHAKIAKALGKVSADVRSRVDALLGKRGPGISQNRVGRVGTPPEGGGVDAEFQGRNDQPEREAGRGNQAESSTESKPGGSTSKREPPPGYSSSRVAASPRSPKTGRAQPQPEEEGKAPGVDWSSRIATAAGILARPFENIEREAPELAVNLRRVRAAPEAAAAVANGFAKKLFGDMTPEQKWGFRQMADAASRSYLENFEPDEFKRYSEDSRIQQAVEDYASMRDEMSQMRRWMGGKTIEGDYFPRTYPEGVRPPTQIGGYFDTGKVGPRRADSYQRLATAQYFYEHGERDPEPEFKRKWMATYLAYTEQQAFASFARDAHVVLNEDQPPAKVTWRGRTLYRRGIIQDVAKAEPGSDLEAKLKKQLGVQVLPDPKKMEQYHEYRFAPANRQLRAAGEELEQALRAGGVEDTSGTIAALAKKMGNDAARTMQVYLAPERIVDAMNSAADKDKIGKWMNQNAAGHALNGLSRFARLNFIVVSQGITHAMNLGRSTAMQERPEVLGIPKSGSMGELDPRGWINAFRVLSPWSKLSEGLKERANVTNTIYRAMLESAAISLPRVIDYTQDNFNPNTWLGHLAHGSSKWLYGEGGVHQRTAQFIAEQEYKRLSDYVGDNVRSEFPHATDDQVAKAVQTSVGMINRASWNMIQRGAGHFMLFPSWLWGRARFMLDHPLKSSLPPAVIALAVNNALYYMGVISAKHRWDPAAIEFAGHRVIPSLLFEPLTRHLMQAPFTALLKEFHAKPPDVPSWWEESGGEAVEQFIPILQEIWWLQPGNRSGPLNARPITEPSDARRRGPIGLSKATWERLTHAVSSVSPLVTDWYDVMSEKPKDEVMSLLGSMFGVSNYPDNVKKRSSRGRGFPVVAPPRPPTYAPPPM